MLTHGSLFSGIGGFEIAAEWMGWQNAFHCEINEFCTTILNYHFPNAEPVHRAARSGSKNRSGDNSFPAYIGFQCFAQPPRNQNRPVLPFEANSRLPGSNCLCRDKLQLGYPDACAADRLNNQCQLFISLLFRGFHQPQVFRPTQPFFIRTEGFFLNFQ